MTFVLLLPLVGDAGSLCHLFPVLSGTNVPVSYRPCPFSIYLGYDAVVMLNGII